MGVLAATDVEIPAAAPLLSSAAADDSAVPPLTGEAGGVTVGVGEAGVQADTSNMSQTMATIAAPVNTHFDFISLHSGRDNSRFSSNT
jgi:hypothetical protein